MHPWSFRRRPNVAVAPARWWTRRSRDGHGAFPAATGTDGSNRDGASVEDLQIRVMRARDARRLTLTGELTERTAPRLAGCLEAAGADAVDRIVVDLSGLRVLEPVAISPLLTAHLRAADEHRELMLIRGPAPVQRVLDRAEGPFRYLSGSRGDRGE